MNEVRFLRMPDVEARCALKKSSIYALCAVGKFPKSIAISERSRAWSSVEIDSWIAARLTDAGRKPGAA